ncbi:MAG: hypothetical protein ACKVS9_10795 [Phycisphaerae bacterium]
MMRLLCVLCIGSSLPMTALATDDVFFLPLGDLPGGLQSSAAYGVSADGRTIGGGGFTPIGVEGIVWRDGVMTGLGDLPGGQFGSFAQAVSADGRVIVGSASGVNHSEPVVWRDRVIYPLPVPNGLSGTADAVSDDGTVIVGGAFMWVNDSRVEFELPSGISGVTFNALSADGTTAVGAAYVSGVGTRAFRLSETFEMLDDLSAPPESNAWGVSADGSRVVGYSYPDGIAVFVPVIWNGTELAEFRRDEIPMATTAHAASADGGVIVGGGGNSAFVWTELDGARRIVDVLYQDFGIGIDDWDYLETANSVSADGRTIVGVGQNALGMNEAFAVRLKYRCTRTDLDFNFETNLVDLAILLAHFGECSSDEGFLPVADVDRRGCVDLPDLAALLSEFGTACAE